MRRESTLGQRRSSWLFPPIARRRMFDPSPRSHRICSIGRLAQAMQSQDGGDGVNRGLLDSTVSDPGVRWLRGVPGECRHVKNVPGRRTDVSDCQWLQFLHSVGLLKASYRPEQEVCAVRSLLRHRESLVQMAAVHIQHMQKALDQMNLQLHHVISDITGTTGLAIISAVLGGERNPENLATLRDPRIVASRETIARALVGDYRAEHLFTLRQSLQ